jgi:hypothetical protein
VLAAAALVVAACGSESSSPQTVKHGKLTVTVTKQCHSQTSGNNEMVLKGSGFTPKGHYSIKAWYPPLAGSHKGDPRLQYIFINPKHRSARQDGTLTVKWDCGYGQGSKSKHHVPDPVGNPYTIRLTDKKTGAHVDVNYPVLPAVKKTKK